MYRPRRELLHKREEFTGFYLRFFHGVYSNPYPVNTTTSGRRQYDVRHVAVVVVTTPFRFDIVYSSARRRADVGHEQTMSTRRRADVHTC